MNQRIAAACARVHRSVDDVTLIAVTKYVDVETTAQVLKHGILHVGESRTQQAVPKWRALSAKSGTQAEAYYDVPEAHWHFIGSLQTNKVKEVVGRFTTIHSLDRIALAQALHDQAMKSGVTVQAFIQVNVSGEPSKHGIAPDELPKFMEQLEAFSSVKPIGLMTMAPFDRSPEASRPIFRALRELRECWLDKLPYLSMGMSNDYEIAIEEGATHIRVGSQLMGGDSA